MPWAHRKRDAAVESVAAAATARLHSDRLYIHICEMYRENKISLYEHRFQYYFFLC